MMRPVSVAFGRALLSQLHIRMLLLTVAPFLLSMLIWGLILYFSLLPLMDWGQAFMVEHDGFKIARSTLGPIGLSDVVKAIVPLLAMWAFLPLMILTALVFIGALAMPAIVRYVGERHFPQLEKRRGGSFGGSMWLSLKSFIVFVLLWLVSLPLSAIPLIGFLVHPLLWGWLTYRVLAYDAKSDNADNEELAANRRQHRWPLLLIGTATGVMGVAPTLLWLGGAINIVLLPVLFPFFATLSIWLYVLVFVFSGFWFEYYCLEALARYRANGSSVSDPSRVPLKDIN